MSAIAVSDQPVRRGQQPVASPAARWFTIVVGIVFLALAVIAGRELWVRHGHESARSLVKPVTHYIGTVHYETWMLPVGILCGIIGLLLLWMTFKPRRKTHQALTDENVSIWMRPLDVARMATAQAEKIPGVMRAHTVAKGSKVELSITGDSTDPTLIDRVGRTVRPLVQQVQGQPELRIKIANDAREVVE